MKNLVNQQWYHYQETPHKKSVPVKLDRILEDRMKAFIKAKKVKSLKVS